MTIPDPRALRTYKQIDRSKQYTRADNPELLRSLNEAWAMIRTLQNSEIRKDARIAELEQQLKNYRIRYTALVAIITGLAWEGVKALLVHFFR